MRSPAAYAHDLVVDMAGAATAGRVGGLALGGPMKRRGRQQPLTRKERLERRVRNEKRNRVPKVVKWEKQHIKSDPINWDITTGKSRAQRFTDKVLQELRRLPEVEDAH